MAVLADQLQLDVLEISRTLLVAVLADQLQLDVLGLVTNGDGDLVSSWTFLPTAFLVVVVLLLGLLGL